MTEPDDELQPQYDPNTLRDEYPDPAAVDARIEQLRTRIRVAPDEIGELLARGELVVLLRASGQLDDAVHEAQLAVDRAEIAGTPPQQHLARLRLAHVQQWRGDFARSNLAFTELTHAATQFGPVIEAFTYHHAGLNAYDQHDWTGARDHFVRALALREEFELPDEQIEASRIALAAAEQHLSGAP
jgi:hypothetical protein